MFALELDPKDGERRSVSPPVSRRAARFVPPPTGLRPYAKEGVLFQPVAEVASVRHDFRCADGKRIRADRPFQYRREDASRQSGPLLVESVAQAPPDSWPRLRLRAKRGKPRRTQVPGQRLPGWPSQAGTVHEDQVETVSQPGQHRPRPVRPSARADNGRLDAGRDRVQVRHRRGTNGLFQRLETQAPHEARCLGKSESLGDAGTPQVGIDDDHLPVQVSRTGSQVEQRRRGSSLTATAVNRSTWACLARPVIASTSSRYCSLTGCSGACKATNSPANRAGGRSTLNSRRNTLFWFRRGALRPARQAATGTLLVSRDGPARTESPLWGVPPRGQNFRRGLQPLVRPDFDKWDFCGFFAVAGTFIGGDPGSE